MILSAEYIPLVLLDERVFAFTLWNRLPFAIFLADQKRKTIAKNLYSWVLINLADALTFVLFLTTLMMTMKDVKEKKTTKKGSGDGEGGDRVQWWWWCCWQWFYELDTGPIKLRRTWHTGCKISAEMLKYDNNDIMMMNVILRMMMVIILMMTMVLMMLMRIFRKWP